MNTGGRAKYEIVIVVLVVALVIAFAPGLYAAKSKVFNDKRMITEISATRSGVTLYMTLNKKRPANLETLFKTTYNAGGKAKRPYLDQITTNTSGQPVDPFGKPYAYDARRGLVSSASSGYEKW